MTARFRSVADIVSTVGGLGRFSSMPGTVASAAACLIALFVPPTWPLILFVCIVGTIASDRYARETGRRDPGEVVIDEVVGTWISLYALPQTMWLPALLVFRILDILKPFPIGAAEALPGGIGIMADDVLGGVCANLLLRGLHMLFFGGGLALLYR